MEHEWSLYEGNYANRGPCKVLKIIGQDIFGLRGFFSIFLLEMYLLKMKHGLEYFEYSPLNILTPLTDSIRLLQMGN